MIKDSIGSLKYARFLGKENYFRIKTGFYEDEDPENVADDILLSVKESLNESTNDNIVTNVDFPVRRVVRDVINIVKSQEYGEYVLPEDAGVDDFEYNFYYEFEKLGMPKPYQIPPFVVELILFSGNKSVGLIVNSELLTLKLNNLVEINIVVFAFLNINCIF